MANEDVFSAPEQNPGVSFFKDPRNLATGLVFLAALAQPRRDGQSPLAAAGERAVGALAFRGGLDSGIRRQRNEEEDRQQRKLKGDKERELAERQVVIGEQGLGLQRDQLSQAERLAREQNANAIALRQTPQAQTPEQAALDRAMAAYYGRMPKGTGVDAGMFGIDPQMLQDISKLQWEQEVKNAALEGRTPDPIKVTNSLFDFMRSIQAAGAAGAGTLVRTTDGGFALQTDALAPGQVPGQDAPGLGSEPPNMTIPAPGVNFAAATPAPSPEELKRIRPRGSNVPSPVMDEVRALSKLSEDQLRQFLKDPRLTKEQIVSVREELRTRDVRKRAMNSSSPGLR